MPQACQDCPNRALLTILDMPSHQLLEPHAVYHAYSTTCGWMHVTIRSYLAMKVDQHIALAGAAEGQTGFSVHIANDQGAIYKVAHGIIGCTLGISIHYYKGGTQTAHVACSRLAVFSAFHFGCSPALS